MSAGNSLQDIMNEVSAGLASGTIPASPAAAPTMSELDAFAMLDPLLADLQKQFLDARGNRIKSQKDNGADDAMTEIAQWAEDSAWCAMQTRYMEVRGDRGKMTEAQRLMQEHERKVREREKEKQARDDLYLAEQLRIFDRAQKLAASEALFEWFLIYFLFDHDRMLRSVYQPSYTFNRLAA